MPKIIQCTVCQEDMECETKDVEFLPCAHAFHKDCIADWINEHPTCPNCKIPIYINTHEQLDAYNFLKERMDRQSVLESQFFQRVSAGAYDNVGSYNMEAPPVESNMIDNINTVTNTPNGNLLFSVNRDELRQLAQSGNIIDFTNNGVEISDDDINNYRDQAEEILNGARDILSAMTNSNVNNILLSPLSPTPPPAPPPLVRSVAILHFPQYRGSNEDPLMMSQYNSDNSQEPSYNSDYSSVSPTPPTVHFSIPIVENMETSVTRIHNSDEDEDEYSDYDPEE